ncbi:hypothetical protein GYMLUDRAFT_50529 [Collybiopsis luxurians FD-317 M1]|uniref:NAD(P)-binding protein n=1 Tax=Collybiopsis luxurians FD-317 M1 TaxID=944289 RepID=A0A0D0C1E3_9AGAR|nr:hypothetical protein GYMLUDRAFT_50529 [Collybiopsis luxurians FD-317 M1]
MAPSVSAVRALNAAFSPSYLPVAVFVGGTSGIGQGMAEAFAQHTKGNAHIILVGRNRTAAESIISKFPRPTLPSAKHEFIASDVSLMKNVQVTTKELLTHAPKINYLVLSAGILNMSGRDETEEGIDKKLAVHYYSRWKFMHELTPALVKAKEAGEDAKALSVFAPGNGRKINVDDLGLKKTYSVSAAALEAPTYNDLMVESFASRYPSVSFVHANPGMVRTNGAYASTSFLIRLAGPIVKSRFSPLALFSRSQEDEGEYLLHGLFSTVSRPGSWRINENGEDMGMAKYFGDDESRRRLWEHTVEVTGSMERTS